MHKYPLFTRLRVCQQNTDETRKVNPVNFFTVFISVDQAIDIQQHVHTM